MRVVPTAIVDKAVVFRAGLAHICSGSRFRINCECSELADLPADFFNKGLCQILIVSLDDREPDQLSQLQSLKSGRQSLSVCVLSDRCNVDELNAAIEADVDGVLLKNKISGDLLLRSLELILSGAAVISCELVRLMKQSLRLSPKPRPAAGLRRLEYRPSLPPTVDLGGGDRDVQLSGRERVILQQLTQGASNKRIARELRIAEATIKVHVRSLLRKIRADNRTQAAMWAVNNLGTIGRDTTADRADRDVDEGSEHPAYAERHRPELLT
jgi:two-component system nitrate/nitrite response regulator NarL